MMHFSWKKEKGNYQFESLSNFHLKKKKTYFQYFSYNINHLQTFWIKITLKLKIKINEIKAPSNNQI